LVRSLWRDWTSCEYVQAWLIQVDWLRICLLFCCHSGEFRSFYFVLIYRLSIILITIKIIESFYLFFLFKRLIESFTRLQVRFDIIFIIHLKLFIIVLIYLFYQNVWGAFLIKIRHLNIFGDNPSFFFDAAQWRVVINISDFSSN